ncbi:hypothetical protein [Bradyrhizobium sp. CCBAU 51627]|uniref:hypothetical protein n=1 Tax=Bradyrhizobium sp. CCBAU 51627 TaxID=1325088 RepID=UPI002306BAC9|nr:hypothetical protein [Bradyrhizobium sp. CCBAU 51627]MDA9437244.1 hypothetical protein [Bradyrhizobium sp. CCBAU 51627]
MQTLSDYSPIVRADEERAAKLQAERAALVANADDLWKMKGATEDREKRAAMIAAGETPPPRESINAAIENLKGQIADYDAAIALHAKNSAVKSASETARYLKSKRPEFNKIASRFTDGLAQTYAAYVELDDWKGQLLSESIGYYPHILDFANEAEAIFGPAREKGGALGNLFRALVAGGHLSSVPEELR